KSLRSDLPVFKGDEPFRSGANETGPSIHTDQKVETLGEPLPQVMQYRQSADRTDRLEIEMACNDNFLEHSLPDQLACPVHFPAPLIILVRCMMHAVTRPRGVGRGSVGVGPNLTGMLPEFPIRLPEFMKDRLHALPLQGDCQG